MSRSKAILCAAVVVCFGHVTDARADWEPAGAISTGLHIDITGDDDEGGRLGGLLLVDLYQPFGAFRLGFAAGIGALSRGDDDMSRVYAPLGLSLAYRLGGERVGAHFTARVGAFGGADFEGLVGGAFLTAGASLDVRFGTLAFALGAEYWALFGSGTRSLITPMVSLRWNPETS